MKTVEFTSYQPQQSVESTASLKLPSGEHLGIYVGHGSPVSPDDQNIRVAKLGWFGIPRRVIWHLCLTPIGSNTPVGGNIARYDPKMCHPLEAMIGYIMQFESVSQMDAVAGNHAQRFDQTKVMQQIKQFNEMHRRKKGIR